MRKPQAVSPLAVAETMSRDMTGSQVAVAPANARVSNVSQSSLGGSVATGSRHLLREGPTLSIDVGFDTVRHAWRVLVHDNGSLIARATVRTTSDDSFRMTRLIESNAGSSQVVFYATNLATGETSQLNGAA